jgi:ribosomal protein S18 acetylase RimI-like enzyme
MFEDFIKNNENGTAVFELNNKIIGFINLGESHDIDLQIGKTGEIIAIYVSPYHWQKGIGTILANWAINEFKKKEFTLAALWVLDKNCNAIKFYEKYGFCSDGCKKQISIGTAIRFLKQISS